MASDWGFNFRNGYACDSDSSDDDAAPKTETDLIREFDLGSRDEGGVKYKPNPFSIAKINAAARGEPASKQGGGKSGKAQGRGKPQTKKAGGGTIEHAFKAQAARPRGQAVKESASKQKYHRYNKYCHESTRSNGRCRFCSDHSLYEGNCCI
ncbi:hypothetical protein GGG16DRAFT_105947 [Schizophyllum commune]